MSQALPTLPLLCSEPRIPAATREGQGLLLLPPTSPALLLQLTPLGVLIPYSLEAPETSELEALVRKPKPRENEQFTQMTQTVKVKAKTEDS